MSSRKRFELFLSLITLILVIGLALKSSAHKQEIEKYKEESAFKSSVITMLEVDLADKKKSLADCRSLYTPVEITQPKIDTFEVGYTFDFGGLRHRIKATPENKAFIKVIFSLDPKVVGFEKAINTVIASLCDKSTHNLTEE